MILEFAKKYNQLIIYVLFPKLFCQKIDKERKEKSDLSGTRTQDLSLSIPSTLPTELPRLFHFLTLLFNSSSSGYW